MYTLYSNEWRPVRSGVTRVGVTRGATGVSPLFFSRKKLTTFLVITVCRLSVCQFRSVIHISFLFSWKADDLFWSSLSLFWFHSGCQPLEGVTRHLFSPVRPYLSTILCKFTRHFFVRVSPPGGCKSTATEVMICSSENRKWRHEPTAGGDVISCFQMNVPSLLRCLSRKRTVIRYRQGRTKVGAIDTAALGPFLK